MATVVALSPAAQSMATQYPVGKLPNQALARLLADHAAANIPGILVGPAVGEDAAAIDLGNDCLIVANDPITFATDAIGHYVVHVNANDVATMGASPRWFLVTVLLPVASTDAQVEEIFQDISAACHEVGAALCGGHTEICADLERPLLVGTMMGTVPRDKMLRTGAARPGDRIWCTKRIPLEATSLLARERPDWARGHLGVLRWQRCVDLLHDPGISVVPEALAAAGAGARALHDPTEGGVATGLHELADAAGVGLEIDKAALPMDADGVALCAAAKVDPLGALASGALLIVGAADRGAAIEAAVQAAGVECRSIGEILPATEGRRLVTDEEQVELPTFAVDEIARWFSEGS
jgi:hydrogenase expression/formation protein HypE